MRRMEDEIRRLCVQLFATRDDKEIGAAEGKPMSSLSFRSGEPIPSSGVYEVLHEAHTLLSLVTLVKGYTFPSCAECAIPVHFMQERRMPHLDNLRGNSRGNIVLRSLPVLKDKAA